VPLFSLLPRPPRATLFPYTTLFRSSAGSGTTLPPVTASAGMRMYSERPPGIWYPKMRSAAHRLVEPVRHARQSPQETHGTMAQRSEEHTSELQSRENLVCRLLLEKK